MCPTHRPPKVGFRQPPGVNVHRRKCSVQSCSHKILQRGTCLHSPLLPDVMCVLCSGKRPCTVYHRLYYATENVLPANLDHTTPHDTTPQHPTPHHATPRHHLKRPIGTGKQGLSFLAPLRIFNRLKLLQMRSTRDCGCAGRHGLPSFALQSPLVTLPPLLRPSSESSCNCHTLSFNCQRLLLNLHQPPLQLSILVLLDLPAPSQQQSSF